MTGPHISVSLRWMTNCSAELVGAGVSPSLLIFSLRSVDANDFWSDVRMLSTTALGVAAGA